MPTFRNFSDRANYAYDNAKLLKRILVLYGGETNEREISIQSGQAVVRGLKEAGVDVVEYEVKRWKELLLVLHQRDCDVVFNLIHGGYGEDGTLHAVLDMLELPYVGSDHISSGLAMNKLQCKRIWHELNLNVPPCITTHRDNPVDLRRIESFPVVIKPVSEGSSNGLSKVAELSECKEAIAKAHEYGDWVIIEKFVEGIEVTVSIVAGEALPPIEISPFGGLYDYNAKYVASNTQFFCPPKNVPKSEFDYVTQQALQAYKAIDPQDWGRVDLIVDRDRTAWILEVNLIPGMTSHSLIPQAAQKVGIDFSRLVCGLVSLHTL